MKVPVFRTKREAFDWLFSGKKTIDIRKGKSIRGQIAVYLSGRKVLRLRIVRCETGGLREIIRLDNFKLVIPSANSVGAAVAYVERFYSAVDGCFTAYYVEPLNIYKNS